MMKIFKFGLFLAFMVLFAQIGECHINTNISASQISPLMKAPIHYEMNHNFNNPPPPSILPPPPPPNQIYPNVIYKTKVIRKDNPFYANNKNIHTIGTQRVYYRNNYPYKVGNKRIIYGANNRITFIGNDPVYYQNGIINRIGNMPVYYNNNREIIRIGNFSVWYGI